MITLHAKQSEMPTLACASFTWLLGVLRERTVSILRKNATTPSPIRLYYTHVGALRCKHLRITNAERQTPPQPLYMVQAICQAWNQSRVNA